MTPTEGMTRLLAAAELGELDGLLARHGGAGVPRARPDAGHTGLGVDARLLSHRYGEVDHRRVAEAVPGAVDDDTDYVTQVSRWLLATPDPPGPAPPT